jgi:hypothetical protein
MSNLTKLGLLDMLPIIKRQFNFFERAIGSEREFV